MKYTPGQRDVALRTDYEVAWAEFERRGTK